MLRATMAVCEVRPPTSVTKPANTLFLNCSMSAGERSCAMSTSGTSKPSPAVGSSSSSSCAAAARLRRGGLGASTAAVPFMRCSMRSTTCSRSALRSRRYGSSISSNWRAMISSCVVSAHSALYSRSLIQCFTPPLSTSSCSSIWCTSSSAASSCGASFGPICATLACSLVSSSATALRAVRTRSISVSISSGLMK
ncbi:hypothetical protein D3C72_800300 [compost metagenome]